MAELLTPLARRYLRATREEPDGTLDALERHARERDFPTVGPDVGRLLRLLTRLTGATKAFEFGSGFGYSGYWIASGLPPEGTVVLVEEDEEELALAESLLERAGLTDRVSFRVGDAIEVVREVAGPFDLVVFDHEDHRYVEALEAVRDRIRPGGVLVADNAMRAGELIDLETLCELLEAEGATVADRQSASPATRGIARYLDRLLDDPAFETAIVPLGDGIAISRQTG